MCESSWRFVVRQRYPYQDGFFVDDDDRRWRREDNFLEPSDVHVLLDQGVPALVEWCGDRRPRPVTIQEGELDAVILPTLLDHKRAARKMRKSRVPNVFVPELWRDGDDRLVIFVEGAPAGR